MSGKYRTSLGCVGDGSVGRHTAGLLVNNLRSGGVKGVLRLPVLRAAFAVLDGLHCIPH